MYIFSLFLFSLENWQLFWFFLILNMFITSGDGIRHILFSELELSWRPHYSLPRTLHFSPWLFGEFMDFCVCFCSFFFFKRWQVMCEHFKFSCLFLSSFCIHCNLLLKHICYPCELHIYLCTWGVYCKLSSVDGQWKQRHPFFLA